MVKYGVLIGPHVVASRQPVVIWSLTSRRLVTKTKMTHCDLRLRLRMRLVLNYSASSKTKLKLQLLLRSNQYLHLHCFLLRSNRYLHQHCFLLRSNRYLHLHSSLTKQIPTCAHRVPAPCHCKSFITRRTLLIICHRTRRVKLSHGRRLIMIRQVEW